MNDAASSGPLAGTGRPLVKVCGLTRGQDVDLCLELGVDLLGFIFHHKSPRFVPPIFPGTIRSGAARKVGLFVSEDLDSTLDFMSEGGCHFAQLHGGQDEEFCREVGPERVIKVLWPERYAWVSALERDIERFAPVCAYFLFDAGTSGGGHGRTLDLSFLNHLRMPRPWILAGGLGPDTLPAALAGCLPDGVDLNSGVESAPGVKDAARLRAAMAIIRPGAGER